MDYSVSQFHEREAFECLAPLRLDDYEADLDLAALCDEIPHLGRIREYLAIDDHGVGVDAEIARPARAEFVGLEVLLKALHDAVRGEGFEQIVWTQML